MAARDPVRRKSSLCLPLKGTSRPRRYREHVAKIGKDELLGVRGKALENFSDSEMISIQGEMWKARPARGVISKGDAVVVSRILDGLTLEVEAVDPKA